MCHVNNEKRKRTNNGRKELPNKEIIKRSEKKKITSHHHHHHHIPLPAQISLTLLRYPSLSFISPERSSRLYPVSAQSCCI